MGRFFYLLIGLAFVVRSLLPAGFMLAATPGHPGDIAIVICTGHGPLNLVLDDQGVPRPAKTPMSGKNVCPYAPVGAVAADQSAPHLLVRTVNYASLTYRVTRERFRATPRPGAQYARGPPPVLT
jgi:hypothetical protein